MRVDRSREWWLQKAQRESGVAVGAGCQPVANLRQGILRTTASNRVISDARHHIHLADLNHGAGIDASIAVGRSVLVQTTKQLTTVLALIELDGVAKRVVLCPPDQVRHMPQIVDMAGINLFIGETINRDLAVPQICYVAETLPYRVLGERSIETEWVLLTSGTTGMPKLVIHTFASLAGPLSDGVLSTGAKWSTFYDVRRYGGMQMLLRALLGDASMILSDADESIDDFMTRLATNGVTHISGTPSHWRRALMATNITAINPTYVRLSGEIADQHILDQLHKAFPQADVAHAYASTEAGVGFDVRDGKAGFPAEYVDTDRTPEVRIINGTLHLRSSRVAKGYVGADLSTTDGFVDTGDLVVRQGDRYIFIGRREGVINVGGLKVYPEEVEAVINQHPKVKSARARGLRNSISGFLVAADVVLETDVALSAVEADIICHCQQYLDRWKVPVRLYQVDDIPLSSAGKVLRHG